MVKWGIAMIRMKVDTWWGSTPLFFITYEKEYYLVKQRTICVFNAHTFFCLFVVAGAFSTEEKVWSKLKEAYEHRLGLWMPQRVLHVMYTLRPVSLSTPCRNATVRCDRSSPSHREWRALPFRTTATRAKAIIWNIYISPRWLTFGLGRGRLSKCGYISRSK